MRASQREAEAAENKHIRVYVCRERGEEGGEPRRRPANTPALTAATRRRRRGTPTGKKVTGKCPPSFFRDKRGFLRQQRQVLRYVLAASDFAQRL